MYEQIQGMLAGQQYKKIPSNIPFVTLYVKYVDSSARVIQLIDCENQIRLTVQQFEVFCQRAYTFIQEKGYEDVNLISIVVTNQIGEARKFVLGNNKCWIVDIRNPRVIIFDNQPEDFFGIRAVLEKELESFGVSSIIEKQNESYYSDYGYTSTSRQNHQSESRGFKDEFTLINTIMVCINIAVFFVLSRLGSTEDVDFMLNHGAMFVPAITEGKEYYRLLTCTFLHFGFTHLSGNMVVLLFLGDNVERAVGKIKYIIIYILGGLIGSLGSFLYAYVYNKGIVSAGASGAIFALIGALLWLVIKNKGKLENMTTLRVCVLIAYALYSGFTSQNVDMAAHLFGLAGGFLLAMIVYRRPVSGGI